MINQFVLTLFTNLELRQSIIIQLIKMDNVRNSWCSSKFLLIHINEYTMRLIGNDYNLEVHISSIIHLFSVTYSEYLD